MGQLWTLKESTSWNKARFESQPPHSVHAASETFLETLEDFMSNQIGWCSVARTMKDTAAPIRQEGISNESRAFAPP